MAFVPVIIICRDDTMSIAQMHSSRVFINKPDCRGSVQLRFKTRLNSSGIKGRWSTDKRIGQAWRPYVSIGWLWAICFYCVAVDHMFLLC